MYTYVCVYIYIYISQNFLCREDRAHAGIKVNYNQLTN